MVMLWLLDSVIEYKVEAMIVGLAYRFSFCCFRTGLIDLQLFLRPRFKANLFVGWDLLIVEWNALVSLV